MVAKPQLKPVPFLESREARGINSKVVLHVNQRSNVESTFSMMKRKFLPYVRSKSDKAQFNEMLCKVVCHNANVLCTAMFELNLDIRFGEVG